MSFCTLKFKAQDSNGNTFRWEVSQMSVLYAFHYWNNTLEKCRSSQINWESSITINCSMLARQAINLARINLWMSPKPTSLALSKQLEQVTTARHGVHSTPQRLTHGTGAKRGSLDPLSTKAWWVVRSHSALLTRLLVPLPYRSSTFHFRTIKSPIVPRQRALTRLSTMSSPMAWRVPTTMGPRHHNGETLYGFT